MTVTNLEFASYFLLIVIGGAAAPLLLADRLQEAFLVKIAFIVSMLIPAAVISVILGLHTSKGVLQIIAASAFWFGIAATFIDSKHPRNPSSYMSLRRLRRRELIFEKNPSLAAKWRANIRM